jgi:hypothetical protein
MAPTRNELPEGKPTQTGGSVSDRGPEAARQHAYLLRVVFAVAVLIYDFGQAATTAAREPHDMWSSVSPPVSCCLAASGLQIGLQNRFST